MVYLTQEIRKRGNENDYKRKSKRNYRKGY